MKQIAVRIAALVIIASLLPLPRIRAQGQAVITSQIADSTWRYFPCASGVIETGKHGRAAKDQRKDVVKAGDKKRSRRTEKRL